MFLFEKCNCSILVPGFQSGIQIYLPLFLVLESSHHSPVNWMIINLRGSKIGFSENEALAFKAHVGSLQPAALCATSSGTQPEFQPCPGSS